MIGTDLTRYCALKAAEIQHDLDRNGDAAQRAHHAAYDMAVVIRTQVNALLAPHGVTLAQLEQAELA